MSSSPMSPNSSSWNLCANSPHFSCSTLHACQHMLVVDTVRKAVDQACSSAQQTDLQCRKTDRGFTSSASQQDCTDVSRKQVNFKSKDVVGLVPMGPAPKMSTFFPGCTMPLRQACIPTDKGSHMAPSSKLTLSGSLKQKSA